MEIFTRNRNSRAIFVELCVTAQPFM